MCQKRFQLDLTFSRERVSTMSEVGWTAGLTEAEYPVVYMCTLRNMNFRVRFKLLRILILASQIALGKIHLKASIFPSVK